MIAVLVSLAISDRMHRWPLLFASIACLLLSSTTAQAAPVECSKVISRVSRGVSRGTLNPADMSNIAESLGTNVAWVEHCMRAYGRRPRRPGIESSEGREERLEALEIYEPEEAAEPEDPGELELRRDRSKPPQTDRRDEPQADGFYGGD